MYIIIVGAGAVGRGLARLALQEQHNVVIIEADEQLSKAALRHLDAQVFQADISEQGILEEANVARADALVATTEDDKINLMAVMLGKKHGVKMLISTVNTEGHECLFEEVGAHVLENPWRVVAEHLYGFLRYPQYEGIVPMVRGKHAFKLTIGEGAPLVGKMLADVTGDKRLPAGLLVVLLQRGDKVLVPDGETRFEAGDLLTLLTEEPISDRHLRALAGR